MFTTLDEMIAALQAQKAAGIAGDTPLGIPERDNNGRFGFAKLDVQPRLTAIAKDEHTKGWSLCRTVSRGGVKAILIG